MRTMSRTFNIYVLKDTESDWELYAKGLDVIQWDSAFTQVYEDFLKHKYVAIGYREIQGETKS